MTREEINILQDIVDIYEKEDMYPTLNDKQIRTIKKATKVLEQEPCEDEYIKVPKKALKYRTAEIVAYNVEWLKKHFDMERAIIFGELV